MRINLISDKDIKCYFTYLYPNGKIKHSKLISFSSQWSLDKLVRILKSNQDLSINITKI